MKRLLVTALSLWVSMSSAETLPNDLKIDCWDQTFAYNTINLTIDKEKLRVRAAGTGVFSVISESQSVREVLVEADVKGCSVENGNALKLVCDNPFADLTVMGKRFEDGLFIDSVERVTVAQSQLQVEEVPVENDAGLNAYSMKLVNNKGLDIVSQTCKPKFPRVNK